MRKKRIEITIEKEELFLLESIARTISVAWCAQCKARVRLLTVDDAAALVHVGARTMYRWIEEARVHFTETMEGRLLVCRNSIVLIGNQQSH